MLGSILTGMGLTRLDASLNISGVYPKAVDLDAPSRIDVDAPSKIDGIEGDTVHRGTLIGKQDDLMANERTMVENLGYLRI